jgi:hypothetical protein
MNDKCGAHNLYRIATTLWNQSCKPRNCNPLILGGGRWCAHSKLEPRAILMMRHVFRLGMAIIITWSATALAQSPTFSSNRDRDVGAAGGLRRPAPVPSLSGEDASVRHHVGPTGKPCLSVRGQARPEKINPKLFEHVITAFNECSKRIKLEACYYQSRHCTLMEVPPYGRTEDVLGIMPSMNGFRFEFREKFGPFESTPQ